MPKNNSKKQSIYNPTGGKRLSKKRIYKLLKKDKMNGGGILKELGNFFSGGDPEKINESNSSGIETPSEESVPTPSVETPSEETPSEETLSEETPSEETPSEETPSEETPSEETPSVETPSEEIPSEAPESNIDGQGNIKTIDNTLSVSEEQSPSVLDGALAVATTAADSAKNTFNEISDAVTTDVNDNEVGEEEDDDVDVSDDEDDEDDDDDEDENKNKLIEIIADQNKTIDNQNTTIDNLNQTIKEQSDKLVQILEKHITDLKQNTTDDNAIQYPPMSPGTMGGKTKGRRSTKKHRSK
jgi:uncharacterized coiled-coil protein SlyX